MLGKVYGKKVHFSSLADFYTNFKSNEHARKSFDWLRAVTCHRNTFPNRIINQYSFDMKLTIWLSSSLCFVKCRTLRLERQLQTAPIPSPTAPRTPPPSSADKPRQLQTDDADSSGSRTLSIIAAVTGSFIAALTFMIYAPPLMMKLFNWLLKKRDNKSKSHLSKTTSRLSDPSPSLSSAPTTPMSCKAASDTSNSFTSEMIFLDHGSLDNMKRFSTENSTIKSSSSGATSPSASSQSFTSVMMFVDQNFDDMKPCSNKLSLITSPRSSSEFSLIPSPSPSPPLKSLVSEMFFSTSVWKTDSECSPTSGYSSVTCPPFEIRADLQSTIYSIIGEPKSLTFETLTI